MYLKILGIVIFSHVCLGVDFPTCWSTQSYDTGCLLVYWSKLLSAFLLVISFGNRIPQVLKIQKAKSVEGISAASFYLDTAHFGIVAAYNVYKENPISTYAESVVIFLQCLLLISLLWAYGSFSVLHKLAVGLPSLLFLGTILIFQLPNSFWSITLLLTIPLYTIGKASQIFANYGNKSTGQLSPMTYNLSTLRSTIRLLSSMVETNDFKLVMVYLFATINNSVITGQIYYYGGKEKTKER